MGGGTPPQAVVVTRLAVEAEGQRDLGAHVEPPQPPLIQVGAVGREVDRHAGRGGVDHGTDDVGHQERLATEELAVAATVALDEERERPLGVLDAQVGFAVLDRGAVRAAKITAARDDEDKGILPAISVPAVGARRPGATTARESRGCHVIRASRATRGSRGSRGSQWFRSRGSRGSQRQQGQCTTVS